MNELTPGGIDALLPQEMAEKAERVGVEKTRLDTTKLLALAVLAGVFVGFGSLFSIVVTAGADGSLSYGMARLLGGLVFSLGLILVIVGGAELFTGNNLMVMACASGKVSVGEVLRAWGLVYVGNFVGSAALAALVFMAAGYTHGAGAVGAAALASADSKASFSALQALVHGFLANILVCLAVWLCYSTRTTTDKILAIVPPVAAFSAAGFEHSNLKSLPPHHTLQCRDLGLVLLHGPTSGEVKGCTAGLRQGINEVQAAALDCCDNAPKLASDGFGDRAERRISNMFHRDSWVDGSHLDFAVS